jgi:predicted nucleotidyltransferase
MNARDQPLLSNHQAFVERFVAACQADDRVLAVFLGGSYARGAADAHSDLDLSLITTDAAYEEFVAERAAFLGRLGELVFLENFDHQNLVFFIFQDDIEGELWFASENHLDRLHSGPYRVLLDKQGMLSGIAFPEPEPGLADQIEILRRQVVWFWHDLSHFTIAMARRQLWWAQGQLHVLRQYCISLVRLRHNFSDADLGSEAYWKLDQALPAEQLAPLQATYCPLERGAMLQAGLALVQWYRELAAPLAQAHEIAYPAALERVMLDRLEKLKAAAN